MDGSNWETLQQTNIQAFLNLVGRCRNQSVWREVQVYVNQNLDGGDQWEGQVDWDVPHGQSVYAVSRSQLYPD
jgi:hypothetical protein